MFIVVRFGGKLLLAMLSASKVGENKLILRFFRLKCFHNFPPVGKTLNYILHFNC